jgi:hypothetical protein
MALSPYRIAAERSPEPPDRAEGGEEIGFLPFAAFVWLSSVARVAMAFARGDTFGTEATLACLVAILLPWLVRDGVVGRRRRRRARG